MRTEQSNKLDAYNVVINLDIKNVWICDKVPHAAIWQVSAVTQVYEFIAFDFAC